MSGVPSLVSMLLVVLLGASPLVGPVCALLCGHSAGSVDGEPRGAHAHATHRHEPHQQAAHAHHPPESVATAGTHDNSRAALSPGESCCAFDVARSALAAAARIQSQVAASQIDAVSTRLIDPHGSDPPAVFSASIPPRPAWSDRPRLILRI